VLLEADVVEDKDDADDVAGRIADGGAAVLHRSAPAVLID
jgi:hypothetical protein